MMISPMLILRLVVWLIDISEHSLPPTKRRGPRFAATYSTQFSPTRGRILSFLPFANS